MADQTTFGVGGPAEYFYIAQSTIDIVKAVKIARQLDIQFYIIGNGSNILVADRGVKGLVIKNSTEKIKILAKPPRAESISSNLAPRHSFTDNEDAQEIIKLEYDESKFPSVYVQLDSGISITEAIFYLLSKGITGLEWFSGIPATVGGAVFINLHGGHRFFSDYLITATILTKINKIKTVTADYFKFDYDYSNLKKDKVVVLTATLRLRRGPLPQAEKIAKTWALKKSYQPRRSAGCIFQNLTSAQQKKLSLPTSSIGYLMDKVLKLKGKTIGQAKISNQHAGFIENLDKAQASDICQLIKLMKQTANKQLKLNLKPEIVFLGFNDQELREINSV